MPDARSLHTRERRLVTIAAIAAGPRLEALDAIVAETLTTADLTVDELLELALHFAVYSGWPRASHLELVVATQWARIHAARGEEPPPWAPIPADEHTTAADHRAAGLARFEEVNRFPAPAIDTPLRQSVIEWVFGDLWGRPGLSRRDRRLVSVTSVAMGDTPFPLSVHVTSALHSGDLGADDVAEVAAIVAVHGDEARAESLRDAAAQAWATRPSGEHRDPDAS